MRRILWSIAAVAAVVLAGARVSAQGLTHKAYLPRVDSIKPTPTRTVDRVGTSVAGTLTALAPTRTPFPTPPPPGPKCNDIMVNGDFEAREGWRASDSAARYWQGDVLLQPFAGTSGLSLHPLVGESTLAVSADMSVPDLNTLSKVEFSYQLAGFTLDHISNSDAFLSAIDVPLGGTSDPQAVETQANQGVVGRWTGRSFDILPKLKEKNRRAFLVGFFVENDVSDNSWWYVDNVSLNVCTKSAAGVDAVSITPGAAVGAAPDLNGWRALATRASISLGQ